jgi:ribonuclease P protein component
MNYLRLKKRSDFQKLFSKGKRAFSPTLTMVYFTAKEMRMGISVGKRHGKSVTRNRIKRLLREAFRAERVNMKGNYSIVLIPKVRDEYDLATFRKHIQCMIKKEKL